MEYFLYAEKSRNFGKTSDLRLRFQIKISVQPHKFIMHTAMVSATSPGHRTGTPPGHQNTRTPPGHCKTG